jgi:hypothetical protein
MSQELIDKIKDFGYKQVEDRDMAENNGYLFKHSPIGLESLGSIELRYWTMHPRINVTINNKQVYESGITTDEKLLKFMEDIHDKYRKR